MEKNNFHYVAVLLDQLYGIEMETEDLEELGLIAWEKIGNRETKLYKYTTQIGPNNSIELPCNAVSIEAITINGEDWNRVTNYSTNGDPNSSFIEENIESSKVFTSPYYMSGKLIPYELVNDTLYFNKNYGSVNILYKGIFVDDEGLPMLSNNEALAIATYLAYVDKYKEGLKTNNTVLINLSTALELKWLKQCDQARVVRLNQNDLNEILNIRDSWGRHSFGNSLKPIKA